MIEREGLKGLHGKSYKRLPPSVKDNLRKIPQSRATSSFRPSVNSHSFSFS